MRLRLREFRLERLAIARNDIASRFFVRPDDTFVTCKAVGNVFVVGSVVLVILCVIVGKIGGIVIVRRNNRFPENGRVVGIVVFGKDGNGDLFSRFRFCGLCKRRDRAFGVVRGKIVFLNGRFHIGERFLRFGRFGGSERENVAFSAADHKQDEQPDGAQKRHRAKHRQQDLNGSCDAA